MSARHFYMAWQAHRWNNAFPLNPLPASPGGPFVLRPELRFAACGDW
jgi:hypothetical protein